MAHPLQGTAAEYLWLLPLLPLVGFAVNGALSLVPAYHAGPQDPSREPGMKLPASIISKSQIPNPKPDVNQPRRTRSG